jgi:replicative DNA helicase
MKQMAKEFEIPVVTLCQLSRKCEERADKRPVLSDLRDSGEIEQDADVVMFVYRDEMYNTDENNPLRGTAEILIRKHREGTTGKVEMAFLKSYRRFEDLSTR